MKKRILIIASFVLSLPYLFSSCNTGTSIDNSFISTDSTIIAAGEASFNKNCGGCHNFRQDGIGPQLGGITTGISANWIHDFIMFINGVSQTGAIPIAIGINNAGVKEKYDKLIEEGLCIQKRWGTT